MIIRCDIVDADLRAFQWHVALRHPTNRIVLGVILAIVLVLTWVGNEADATVREKLLSLVSVCLGVAVFSLVVAAVLHIAKRLGLKLRLGTLGEHSFEITDHALIETNPFGKVETRSAGVLSIFETAGHFFILTKANTGHIVPKRCLDSVDATRAQLDRLKSSVV
jgi:hypothetical protein